MLLVLPTERGHWNIGWLWLGFIGEDKKWNCHSSIIV
jgi:hypothetical protein